MEAEIKAYIEGCIIPLIGYTIVHPIRDESGEFYGFTAEKDGKSVDVFVNCDPEGNGAGFLDIQED